MRLITVVLCALLSSGIYAQFELESLPGCAVQCAQEFFPDSPCNPTDYFCLCSDTSLLHKLEGCPVANCTIREALTAKNYTVAACHLPSRNESTTISRLAPAIAAVSLVFVLIRFVVKWQTLGWDDACIAVAWLTGLVTSVLNTLMTHYGLGKDVWLVSFNDVDHMLFLFYISELFYLSSTVLSKIGICLFLLRIFPMRAFNVTVRAIAGAVASTGVVFAMTLIFQCTPISFSWLFWDGQHKGTCINRNLATWAHACVNILLDLVILSTPLIQLWILKTSYSTRKMVYITVMFSVGLIVTIVSILRLQSLVVFMQSHNFTIDNLACVEWSVVEIHVGVICACLPAARIFFGRTLPAMFGNSTNGSAHVVPQYVENHPCNRRSAMPVTVTWDNITSSGRGMHTSQDSKGPSISLRMDELNDGGERRASDSPIMRPELSKV